MMDQDNVEVGKGLQISNQESIGERAARRAAYQVGERFTEYTSKSLSTSGDYNQSTSSHPEDHTIRSATNGGFGAENYRFRTCRVDQRGLPSVDQDTGSLHVETSSPVRTSSSTTVQGTDQSGDESTQTTTDIPDDGMSKPQGVQRSSLLGIGMQFQDLSEVNGCVSHSRPQALNLPKDDRGRLDRT